MAMPEPETPSILLCASEPLRAFFDIASMTATTRYLADIPAGDGHHVLVLPGFMAGDRSTILLRQTLKKLGYAVHGWDLGVNLGPRNKLRQALFQQFDDIYHQNGQQKISIIGQSLGGIYARYIAHKHPERIRQVITLGSPYHRNGAENSWAGPLFKRMMGEEYIPTIQALSAEIAAPLCVPTTSVYSKFDGIVAWQSCIEPSAKNRENIAVTASHVGMAMHAPTLRVVADRLAQKENQWQPFDPQPYGCSIYPDAEK